MDNNGMLVSLDEHDQITSDEARCADSIQALSAQTTNALRIMRQNHRSDDADYLQSEMECLQRAIPSEEIVAAMQRLTDKALALMQNVV